ncbi:helix-turn-helix domain-containing protein [Streptomyces sp. NRRL S-340]|uniref:helix-turn-helix domain-containing protein n=1 Tax=Streptomyces sp. NRRL S-340 TaxID=1463901 RepID=UPI00055F4CDE|nr:helix-turn-helix domain-containing protein [Streptomyces sp. NRRL S-340]
MQRTPAGRTRLAILEWLKDPVPSPSPGRRAPRIPTAGRAARGRTARSVATGLGIPRRVIENHLALLAGLGLVRARRVGRRTYYRRDEARIAQVTRMFENGW